MVDTSVTKETDGLCNHDSIELVAIPARKSIFVSRLSSDTTTGKVLKYIQCKLTMSDPSKLIFVNC
uniref:Uncharacterized protein n=1 Tax=Glossina palpalis gambiensis TaxID=67801 RepID=A0A1B0BT31_9MUSC